jgi:hypothetical protein
MDRKTGKALTRAEHIKQSMNDIVTTPIGSRLYRRDYGSEVFELLDQPQNPALNLMLQSVVVMALVRNEPRIRLTHVKLSDVNMSGERVCQIGYEDNGQLLETSINL